MKMQNINGLSFKAVYIGGTTNADKRRVAYSISQFKGAEDEIIDGINDIKAKLSAVPNKDYLVNFWTENEAILDSTRKKVCVTIEDLNNGKTIGDYNRRITDECTKEMLEGGRLKSIMEYFLININRDVQAIAEREIKNAVPPKETIDYIFNRLA